MKLNFRFVLAVSFRQNLPILDLGDPVGQVTHAQLVGDPNKRLAEPGGEVSQQGDGILPLFLSRFPVGSSAKISWGLASTDRAMATRYCSPPESSLGYFFSLPSMPKSSVICRRNDLFGFSPSSFRGMAMLLSTVEG